MSAEIPHWNMHDLFSSGDPIPEELKLDLAWKYITTIYGKTLTPELAQLLKLGESPHPAVETISELLGGDIIRWEHLIKANFCQMVIENTTESLTPHYKELIMLKPFIEEDDVQESIYLKLVKNPFIYTAENALVQLNEDTEPILYNALYPLSMQMIFEPESNYGGINFFTWVV